MEKKFTKFEIATIKRTAQNVNPLVTKKHKIMAKMSELAKELNSLIAQQEAWESAIKEMTGGYTTEQLVDKVVTSDGTKDKNGNEIKITKYVLKYPNSVVPPTPTDVEWVNEGEAANFEEDAPATPDDEITVDDTATVEMKEDEEYNPFAELSEDEVPPYATEE
jgi:hypothetical protein